jgi:DNA/RNA endonuclease YhcR with UshA esterase domain
VTVEGVIASAVDRRPKALYLGFADPHDGALLVRIFERDLARFGYDPLALKGRRVRVTGLVTLYWPLGRDPEIVVTDPDQIVVLRQP